MRMLKTFFDTRALKRTDTLSTIAFAKSTTQEGTNVHFSNVHFVLCQSFGLNHLTL